MTGIGSKALLIEHRRRCKNRLSYSKKDGESYDRKDKENSKSNQSLRRVSLAIIVISQNIFRENVESTREIRIRVMKRKKTYRV